jgi:hypothetical protein
LRLSLEGTGLPGIAGPGDDIDIIYRDTAGIRFGQPDNLADQRGFTGAVGSQ